MKQIINLATRPCSSDSSQEEVQHVGHVLIVLGFIPTSGGPRRPCLHLKINLVPKPGHRGLELLGDGPGERTRVLTLLVHVVTVERLIQLPLPSMISRLLASHVTLIPVHLEFYPIQAIRDGPQRLYLLLRWWWHICGWLLVLLLSGKRQGHVGLLRVHWVSHGCKTCKLINGVRNQWSHVHTHLCQNSINQLRHW